jgi:hypothetical protein
MFSSSPIYAGQGAGKARKRAGEAGREHERLDSNQESLNREQ